MGLDVITVVGSIVGSLGGFEFIKYFADRKRNKRILEAKADNDDFEVLRKTVEFLQQQLHNKEERFAEQTHIVRELNGKIIDLMKEKGQIELDLQKYMCVVKKCANREPQNGY